MAQIDAEERDYVSLAALRDGATATQAGAGDPAYGLLACVRIGLIGSPVMRAFEKRRTILEVYRA
jgi:hypothetical protein